MARSAASGAREPMSPGPRERILAAAGKLFADRGFEAVTLRAIAAEVGLHNSSLFHHFSSKAAIAAEVFEAAVSRLAARFAPLREDDPPRLETLLAVLGDVAAGFAREPEDARLLLRAIVDPNAFLDAYTARLQGSEGGPVADLFTSVWGWLGRARDAGVVRDLNVYQTSRNLFGILLFDPAYSLIAGVPGFRVPPPEDRLERRLEELEAFVDGALAPRR